jgi:hypothetical protein
MNNDYQIADVLAVGLMLCPCAKPDRFPLESTSTIAAFTRLFRLQLLQMTHVADNWAGGRALILNERLWVAILRRDAYFVRVLCPGCFYRGVPDGPS